MMEFTTREMPRWYPVSISGYHIGEAGSTPVQQAAYTLSNGFAYAEMMAARGIPVDEFGPRLSFFLDCGLDGLGGCCFGAVLSVLAAPAVASVLAEAAIFRFP